MKKRQKNMQTLSYLRAFDVYTQGRKAYLIYSFPREKELFFRLKESADFFSFSDTKGHLSITSSLFHRAENPANIEELSVSRLSEEKYFMTYTKQDSHSRTCLYSAFSSDGKKWKKTEVIEDVHSFGTITPWYLFERHYVLYFGDSAIRIATSPDLHIWHTVPGSIIKPRKGYFDQSDLRVARVLNVGDHIALFYFAKNKHRKLCLGVALLDKQAPGRVVWRSEYPLWEQPDHWVTNKIHILGIVQTDESFIAYFKHGRGEIFAHTLRYDREVEFAHVKKQVKKSQEKKDRKKKEDSPIVLKRFYDNPIIEPKKENHWEALATFNSAALCLDNKVHLIYRAQDHGGISVFGYASSTDGVHIEERSNTPIYFPHEVFETSKGKSTLHPYPVISGGGWGGCEDPRLTKIDDTIYMIYIAFNGSQPPGVALTSIKTDDFLNKIWKWQTPRLISRPGQIQKNWVIFPEKINGKFAVLHSITPKISIDYLESLQPDDVLIDSYHTHQQYANKERWDNIVRGVGAPPLRTEYGWLVLYHAMDFHDPNRYKVGAMLLDLNDPTKIIARCTEPILEPDEKYENDGLKSGVVYVCGAVIKDETLFVYYGGADMFVAVASTPIKTFLEELLSSGKTSFQNKK